MKINKKHQTKRNIFFLSIIIGILQQYKAAANVVITQIVAQEISTLIPQITITLQVKNSSNQSFEIFWSLDKGNRYVSIGSNNATTITIGGVPNAQEVYFKLKIPSINYESPVAISIFPKTSNSNYGEIDLNWNKVGNNTNYEITRIGGSSFIPIIQPQNNFIDADLDCNTTYRYQVKGKYTDILGNVVSIISHGAWANTAFSNPPPAKKAVYATILPNGNTQIEVLDLNGSTKYYSFYREIDNNGFKKLFSTPSPIYEDGFASASINKVCYYVTYTDACNNESSNSSVACTIKLEGKKGDLDWNPPHPASNIIYQVSRIDPPTQYPAQTTKTFTVQPLKTKEKYQVTAFLNFTVRNQPKQVQSVSTIFETDLTEKIYFPNTFTPNGDRVNDIYSVFIEKNNLTHFSLTIYNRWGNIVFETDDPDLGWNGNINNEPADVGDYILKAFWKDKYGMTYNQNWHFMLLK